jgi:hypothetical protein
MEVMSDAATPGSSTNASQGKTAGVSPSKAHTVNWNLANDGKWCLALTQELYHYAQGMGCDSDAAAELSQETITRFLGKAGEHMSIEAGKQVSSPHPKVTESNTRAYVFKILKNLVRRSVARGIREAKPIDPYTFEVIPDGRPAGLQSNRSQATQVFDQQKIEELIAFFMHVVFGDHYYPLRNSPLTEGGVRDDELYQSFCDSALQEPRRSGGSNSAPKYERYPRVRFFISRRRIMLQLLCCCRLDRSESDAVAVVAILHSEVQKLNPASCLYTGDWSTGLHSKGGRSIKDAVVLGWCLQERATARASLRNSHRKLEEPRRLDPNGIAVLEEDRTASDPLIPPSPTWFRQHLSRMVCVDNDGEQQ